MIPGGDHSSRSLLFRRISSWSEVTNPTRSVEQEENTTTTTTNNNNNNNNTNNSRSRSNDTGENGILRQPLLQLSFPIAEESNNWNDENVIIGNGTNDGPMSPLLPQHLSLEYEEQSHHSSVDNDNDDNWRNGEERQQSKCCSARIGTTDWKLWVVFGFLVASGVGNVIFAKLQSLPMYNYPTFLNIYANGMYVLMSFAYILPVSILGLFGNSIPRSLPTRAMKPFFIMGALDALGAAMQFLATVYLPGTLLVLIPQAAIPLSMAAGSFVLRERYTIRQYIGAVVVFCGILVVLYPILSHQREADYYCKAIDTENDCLVCRLETTKARCLSHNANDHDEVYHNFVGQQQQQQQQQQSFWRNLEFESGISTTKNNVTDDDSDGDDGLYCAWVSREEASIREEDFLVFFWSIVMLLSCVPSVMSTVYKQVALQTAVSMDPILINGWVSFFQLICGFFLVVPSGLMSSPRVHPLEIRSNWRAGMGCLFAQTNSIESGCHPDDCSQAALWVHVSLLNSVVYALSMLFVLKYGSCDLMYLGLTLVVPLGHLAFDVHSSFSELRAYDIAGLVTLVAGLVLYRFGHVGKTHTIRGERIAGSGDSHRNHSSSDNDNDDNNTRLRHPYERMGSRGETSGAIGLGNAVSPPATTTNDSFTNNSRNNDKEGFLEFLREPFMLVGDI